MTVNIIKEPQIDVNPYTRNDTSLTNTPLTDEQLVLTIDRANHFQFKVDDLEQKFSHVNWQSIASDNAAYKLKDEMDVELLTYIKANLATTPDMIMGADLNTAPITDFTSVTDMGGADNIAIYGGGGANGVDPLDIMARFARVLDVNNVPSDGRWFLAGPQFYEALASTSSKLMSVDYNGGMGSLRNGLVMTGRIRGFDCYVSNNMPTPTTAPAFIMAGHKSAVACAESLLKTEVLRDNDAFKDKVRGLHVYGRKLLRDTAVMGAYVSYV